MAAKKKSTSTSKTPVKKPLVNNVMNSLSSTKQQKKSSKTSQTQKSSLKTTQKKSTTPKLKRKELSNEEMFPFESFIYRLEYKDGNETRICHFQCEEHRTKHIERYKLRKGTYFIDTPS
jgi:phage/plasmid primase-like uncharacterized protein